ncbi:MAG: response regulator transcription factor [Gammaproteobacteria bacterium]|nr:response regulator transcription factor [Gammaproteobacteria bacterium]
MDILLIDDHPLFRAGIAGILHTLTDQVRLIEVNSCEEALKCLAKQEDFDLILLDLNLPGIDGLSGLNKIRSCIPTAPIVILSASENHSHIKDAISQGAKGFIPKSADSEVIINALRLVLSGGVYLPMAVFNEDTTNKPAKKFKNHNGDTLTKRQHEVLLLLVQGKTNKSIAKTLTMAENTVRVHVVAILRFLNVNNRTEATYAAKQKGLI